MLRLRCPLPLTPPRWEPLNTSRSCKTIVVVCATRGPRPRYPRVWKTNKKVGSVSKAAKFVECVKGLSNVKEEVYGALDSFVAWDVEFPLITVKKALKTLEYQREWKRVIQVAKWMLSKGQGRTMGTYFTLINALAEDDRLDEVEELWTKLFSDHLEGMPRHFFDKMISIYYSRDMHDKIFEIFADMEELGVRPNVSIVRMVGDMFLRLDMLEKFEKLKRKYPPPRWVYRYIKGKRIRILAKPDNDATRLVEEIRYDSDKKDEEANGKPNEVDDQIEICYDSDEKDDEEANGKPNEVDDQVEIRYDSDEKDDEEANGKPNEVDDQVEIRYDSDEKDDEEANGKPKEVNDQVEIRYDSDEKDEEANEKPNEVNAQVESSS